jgi:hypothetical protein
MLGTAPASAFGQLSRVTDPWSGISGSVTLSLKIVSRTLSTGWSSISCGTTTALPRGYGTGPLAASRAGDRMISR